MRGKKVKELRAAMMVAQFEDSDLATRADRKMIKRIKDSALYSEQEKRHYLRDKRKPTQ
jgi:hypothetical protein